jgi:methylmalonyl-CoA mutase
MLDLIELRLETAPFEGRKAADLIKALVARRRTTATALTIDLGLDPIGDMARTGGAPLPFAKLAKNAATLALEMMQSGFKGHFVRVDTRAIHEAGGSEAQELGYALATAVAYLRMLESEGMALDEAARITSFTLAVDADQFLTIAKLRALRKLMARVHAACGLSDRPIRIDAETAWRMQTQRDAGVNMLRNAIAVFAAGVGGADSVAVLPHSLAQGLPDGFARRVARNCQHVLMEESNLWRVVDPAAGAGGVEALTDELCARGWALFQEIEAAGGVVAALESGLLQGRIAAARAARDKGIATRRIPITGTSEFPNLNERDPDVVAGVVAHAPAAPELSGATFSPLGAHRLAEPYEALRDRSDATLAATGARPRVFLANLGRIADFNARATFAKNFFEAGGIEAVTNDGFAEGDGTDLVAMTDAFKASKAALACLCSSDAVYGKEAVDAAMALMASGAARVSLAGRPAELEGALAAAGVTNFIFVGCDVLKTLTEALDVARS